MDKTTIYLSKELRESLQDLARRTGRPQAQIIREALASYVFDQDVELPTSFGSGADEELSSDTVEDWLGRNWEIS